MPDKQQVHDFWNEASCGENLYLRGSDREAYESQAQKRYKLEPYIPEFAGFDLARSKRVLEIGVGLGADHQRFAEAGADLTGIDLTERAVEHTARRLAAFGLSSRLAVGDAERLEFPDEFFDHFILYIRRSYELYRYFTFFIQNDRIHPVHPGMAFDIIKP